MKTQECALKPKENMIKSVKTLKEEIFESLNRNIPLNQIKTFSYDTPIIRMNWIKMSHRSNLGSQLETSNSQS